MLALVETLKRGLENWLSDFFSIISLQKFKVMTYSEQLKDSRWQKKRKEILERDGNKCRECKCTDRKLHVHHGYYKKSTMAWDYDNKYLHTLCDNCHENYHYFHDKLMELSGEMLPTVMEYIYKILLSINSKAKEEWYDIGDVNCYTDWIIETIQQLHPIKKDEREYWLD